jgi:hypothetical protein
LDLSVIITLVSLAAKSRRDYGFTTVPDRVSDGDEPALGFLNISWDLAILWTVLPSAVLQLLSIYWIWIAGSLASRQPYVDLAHPRGVPAASSVLLDYRCTPTPWRWLRALRLGHTTVALTTLTGLALQYIATPFGARLFTTQPGLTSTEISVSFKSAHNWSSVAHFDWRPALSSARVAIVQGESRLPWTNDEFAFRPFAAATHRSGSYYMAADTTAYSAYVNCEVVYDYTMSLELEDPGRGLVQVTGTDRGCEVSHKFAVIEEGPGIFFKTSNKMDCSSAAHYSRLFFTAGTYSPTSLFLLSNISVISCATDYQAVNGTLEVAVASSSSAPAIRSFRRPARNEDSNLSIRHEVGWQLIEEGMLRPVVFNPSSAPWATSEFGSTVLYVAEKLAGNTDYLTAPVLSEAIARVFTATYAIGTAMGTFDPLAAEERAPGTVWTPTTRLVVVEWAAYLVAGLLLTVLVLTGWVSWHAHHTRSILTEEPEGLLAMAGLLDGSELMALVPYIRQQPGYKGRVKKTGKRLAEVKDSAWVAEVGDDGGVSAWRVMRKVD